MNPMLKLLREFINQSGFAVYRSVYTGSLDLLIIQLNQEVRLDTIFIIINNLFSKTMFLTIAQTLLYHFYTIDYKAGHSIFFEDIFCLLHLFPCSSAQKTTLHPPILSSPLT